MEKSKLLILSFSNIRTNDLPMVGGKGANLGEMTSAGFPIPDGFCLTTIAFKKFMDASNKSQKIYNTLDALSSNDLEELRKVGEVVRNLLLEAEFPEDIAKMVGIHWKQLGTEHAYSVRSSATAEDLPEASFAGQQDTYLNVIGEASLLDAIKRCWISLFTDRAILYRNKNNFAHQDVLLSVIVQKMVQSEKSGILFTADPVTGHRNTLIIDAGFGLGEALVSGIVNPDAYQVDKESQSILNKTISEKEVAIISEKEGGTKTEKLKGAERTKAVLSDEEIIALAKIGSEIEVHYGSPQDIEWAFADGKFYILQSRPITSLFPIDGLKSPDGSLLIYFSFGHQQMMTDAMTPLGASTFKCLFPLGRPKGTYESVFVKQNAGRLFVDLTNPLRHKIFRKLVFTVTSRFDALAPQTFKIAMRHPKFWGPHGISIPFSRFRAGLGILFKVMRTLWWQNLDGFIPKTNQILDDYILEVKAKIQHISEPSKKVKHVLESFNSMIPVALNWIPQLVASELAKVLIGKFAHSNTTTSDIDALSLGLKGNVVTEMNLEVGNLADLARSNPEIVAVFQNLEGGSKQWLKSITDMEDAEEFFKAWHNFLQKYGSRGPSEVDIMALKWFEEPLPLLQMISGYLQNETGSHLVQHHKLKQQRLEATKRVLEQSSKGLWGWLRKPIIKRLIYVLKEVGGLREHHKFMLIQNLRTWKEMLKEVDVALGQSMNLEDKNDIWFLSWSELLQYSKEQKDVRQLVKSRKEDFERFKKLSPPAIITSDGEAPVVHYDVGEIPEGALVGNPVSGGVTEGVVKVITNPYEETLKPGEILVASFTDPGWTPLFINAGGLILEVGGAMTHGSVVAREYGIPAVVSVKNAVTTFETGQHVRVDGNRGVIEIL